MELLNEPDQVSECIVGSLWNACASSYPTSAVTVWCGDGDDLNGDMMFVWMIPQQ